MRHMLYTCQASVWTTLAFGPAGTALRTRMRNLPALLSVAREKRAGYSGSGPGRKAHGRNRHVWYIAANGRHAFLIDGNDVQETPQVEVAPK